MPKHIGPGRAVWSLFFALERLGRAGPFLAGVTRADPLSCKLIQLADSPVYFLFCFQ